MKIVINTCYGGFGLSEKAFEIYKNLSGNQIDYSRDIERTDKDLVKVVEQLGVEAHGQSARLKVIEIPDDVEYYIEEYDGNEHVAEKHRTWF